ncbi:coiled-coil domain-containing protein 66 isoform X2 [Protopterus annectens]|uniref:coiled-coil domain-containing protein 66 isoform X2 n=1 Tax=Protopterus annectens TaxID=7888 RepID=UPI001CFB42D5|nr:coiled-coil domain-containing protein 66 isoform X2 [Protopterus annectens]
MNLGDGLKLETRVLDGKPKLILAKYDSQPKEAKKISSKTKALKYTVRVKQVVHDAGSTSKNHTKQDKSVAKITSINGTVPGVSLLAEKIPREHVASIQKTNGVAKNIVNEHMQAPQRASAVNQNAEKLKTTVKKPSSLKQGPQKRQKISAEDLRDSLVCLTQEQFQKILATITQASKSNPDNQDSERKEELVHETSSEQSKGTEEMREESIAGLLGKEMIVSSNYVNSNSEPNEKHEAVEENKCDTPEFTSAAQTKDPPDFFNTLGERENDKDQLDARKAQWKKELDEQVAAKKKERALQQTEKVVYPWGKPMGVTSSSCYFENGLTECQTKATLAGESDPAVKEDRVVKTASAAENTDKSLSHNTSSGKPASFSSPDLPAAIRSAFVLGEAAPLDHPFSAAKHEQQKQWLEELDKQREEAKARKIQDRMKRMEAEEHDKWAVHFDSFQKKPYPDLQHQSSTPRQNLETPSMSLEVQASDVAAIFPSAPSHVPSSENHNIMRSSLDATSGDYQKHSFLRTMTALLDPAQIEERERKRQKQLEHQKAIAEQVKERQMLKGLEEAKRRQEEQAEERRLAQEREKMQKQFEEDMLRQKEKEELQTRKINELYQSVQRAQEQAVKLKQEQRIKELSQKGHNISNLQWRLGDEQSPVNSTAATAILTPRDFSSSENKSELNENAHLITEADKSPRKDTAVQTDNSEVPDKVINSEAYTGLVIEKHVILGSPDIPVEYRASSNCRKLKSESRFVERNATGREISKYNSLSDEVARTHKHHATHLERLGKKPEWNTSKPVKKYIPASERYPSEMQKEREENKMRRQMEILNLVERNAFENLGQKKRSSPRNVLPDKSSASPDQVTDRGGRAPHKMEENMQKGNLDNRTHISLENRPNSPPVPAVKNRLHQLQQRQTNASKPSFYNDTIDKNRTVSKDNPVRDIPEISDLEIERPPSAHFVPYLRTNEVYHLDPDAPMSRPSTQDAHQKLHKDTSQGGQVYNSSQMRDPLLNPDLLKNRDRQQAILRGLSELRQGLLQKQKELESGLSPGMLH